MHLGIHSEMDGNTCSFVSICTHLVWIQYYPHVYIDGGAVYSTYNINMHVRHLNQHHHFEFAGFITDLLGSHEILAAYNFFFEHIGIRKGAL